MTTEEIVVLVEKLLDGTTLSGLRSGSGPSLDDEGFVLAVRFLSGERPDGASPGPGLLSPFPGQLELPESAYEPIEVPSPGPRRKFSEPGIELF